MVTWTLPSPAACRRAATAAQTTAAVAAVLALLSAASPRAERVPFVRASVLAVSANPATASKAPAVAASNSAPAPSASPTAPTATTPVPIQPTEPPRSLPDFTLPDLEGKVRASKEWQGKVILVDFWATWCAGCRETIPALSRMQEKYGAQGLSVIGISLDKGAKAKVGKFARKLKVNYQMLIDSEDTLSKVFGFEGLPSLYLFDRQGNLVKAMVGYTAVQDKDLESLVAAQVKGKP